MNNEAPQAMSQRVGHYHTLDVLLFIAERKKTRAFVCVRVCGGALAATALVLLEGARFHSLPPLRNTFRYFAFKGAYG